MGNSIKSSLSYNTVHIVSIQDWKLGFLHYSLQILLLGYIVSTLVAFNGYQKSEPLIGTTSIKVKGLSFSNISGVVNVWDAVDLVIPADESDGVFVTTNFWPTYNQSQSQCYGTTPCTSNADCQETRTDEGFMTGYCGEEEGLCRLFTWCPMEEEPEPAVDIGLTYVDEFTIFVRTNVRWPAYGIVRDNADEGIQDGVNVWTIRDFLALANTTFEDVELTGAMFAMNFNWECNFDLDESLCQPTVNLYRLDDPDDTYSNGYNFRRTIYTSNDQVNPLQTRQLFKHYGIRIVVLTSGRGSKFDITTLLTNIGAGIGLLSVATLACDFIALNLCGPRRNIMYQDAKIRVFHDPEDVEEDPNIDKGASQDPNIDKAASLNGDQDPLGPLRNSLL